MKINKKLLVVGEIVVYKDMAGGKHRGHVNAIEKGNVAKIWFDHKGGVAYITAEKKKISPVRWDVIPCVILYRAVYDFTTTIESKVFELHEKEYRVEKCLWYESFSEAKKDTIQHLRANMNLAKRNIASLRKLSFIFIIFAVMFGACGKKSDLLQNDDRFRCLQYNTVLIDGGEKMFLRSNVDGDIFEATGEDLTIRIEARDGFTGEIVSAILTHDGETFQAIEGSTGEVFTNETSRTICFTVFYNNERDDLTEISISLKSFF